MEQRDAQLKGRRKLLQLALESSGIAGDPDASSLTYHAFFELLMACIVSFVSARVEAGSVIPPFHAAVPSRLSFTNPESEDNDVLRTFNDLATNGVIYPSATTAAGSFARLLCCAVYSFALPNERALECILRHCHELRQSDPRAKLVEIGAGSGYWCWLLARRDPEFRFKCYDMHPPLDCLEQETQHPPPDEEDEQETLGLEVSFVTVRRGAPVSVFAESEEGNSDMLLLVWPPPAPNEMGFEALRLFQGALVAFVGDFKAGFAADDAPVTGTAQLHDALRRDWKLVEHVAIPRWLDEMGDALHIFARK
ncbi:hypothetical protein DFJ74DRAFT_501766 [Hyaloraphidium curvatum]|nr:hypothetical protein DFJ74DRAFT_501766 [Hyaloraphidium curvatum]